jgi:purine-binding chemotaxis protein CheW
MLLFDLRSRLGMPTAEAELRSLLDIFAARERDHRSWYAALQRAVHQGEPFGLTLDPTKCAFGRWYHEYRTDNLVVSAQLRRIDAPHRRLHARGATALAHLAAGRRKEAMAEVDAIGETEFRDTVAYFKEAQDSLADEAREVAVVVEHEGRDIALAVDAAEMVERLSPVESERRESPFVEGYAQRAGKGGFVLLLDVPRLLSDGVGVEAALTESEREEAEASCELGAAAPRVTVQPPSGERSIRGSAGEERLREPAGVALRVA